MTLLLKKHKIIVPIGARKADHRPETKEHDETCDALKARCSRKHALFIDSRASNHMVASRESFSSLQSTNVPCILMGNDSQI